MNLVNGIFFKKKIDASKIYFFLSLLILPIDLAHCKRVKSCKNGCELCSSIQINAFEMSIKKTFSSSSIDLHCNALQFH